MLLPRGWTAKGSSVDPSTSTPGRSSTLAGEDVLEVALVRAAAASWASVAASLRERIPKAGSSTASSPVGVPTASSEPMGAFSFSFPNRAIFFRRPMNPRRWELDGVEVGVEADSWVSPPLDERVVVTLLDTSASRYRGVSSAIGSIFWRDVVTDLDGLTLAGVPIHRADMQHSVRVDPKGDIDLRIHLLGGANAREDELSQKVVVCGQGLFTLANSDFHLGLIVSDCREGRALRARDGGVAFHDRLVVAPAVSTPSAKGVTSRSRVDPPSAWRLKP